MCVCVARRCAPPSPLNELKISPTCFSADTHRRVLAGISPARGGGSVFRAKPVPTIVSKHLVALRGIPSAVRYNPGEEQAPLHRGEGISGIVAVQLVTCSVISCTTVGAGQDNERCLAQIACTILSIHAHAVVFQNCGVAFTPPCVSVGQYP